MPLRLPRVVSAHGKVPRIAQPVAEPGEWAVAGAFRFAHRDPATLTGREAPVFHAAWLGLGSFAPAFHCEVATIGADALEAAARRLTAHLLGAWDAATPEIAAEMAREEIGMALALADHPPGTLLALRREFGGQGLVERAVVIGQTRAAP
jgi:hypothetical protein